jgi:histone-lysine N-methyltransferase SETMAR
MKKLSPRRVPHTLSPEQMQQRVETAQLMKQILVKTKKMGCINLITSDENWFFLSYHPSGKWSKKDDVPTVTQTRSHYSEKVMITVCFSSQGLQLIHLLPPKSTMTATVFIRDILRELEKVFITKALPEGTPHFVHYDNARAHVCKMTSQFLLTSTLERMPHPPYSPDISLCDFYLFGYLKHYLGGMSFENPILLKNHIVAMMKGISAATYTNVFKNWIERIDFVIESGGKYFNKKYDV